MYERSLHMIKHDLFWGLEGLEGYEMFLAILPSNLWLAHLSGNSWWLNRTVIAQQTFCIDMSLLMRISQNCTRKRFLNIWAQTQVPVLLSLCDHDMYNMENTYWILYKYWFNIILENLIFSIKWIKIYFHVSNYEMIELKLIFQVNKQYFIYLEHHVSRCLRPYVQKSFSCAILWNSH
jgi:hypothetical protein